MATLSTRPVTREMAAYVRDRGLRAVIATLVGGVIELRAKGLRSREVLDVGWCYLTAVKARVSQEKAAKTAARKAKRVR